MTIINLQVPDRNIMTYPVQSDQNITPLFSFGLIADVQYCDCNTTGTRYYRSSKAKLTDAINVFKSNSVSFLVNLGDMIDRNFESFNPILDILNSSNLKTYHCTGNHDYAVEAGLKGKIPVLQSGGTRYYKVNIGNFRLIFLEGNEVSTYSSENKETSEEAAAYIQKLKDKGSINAYDWNGGIGKEQMKWIEAELKEAGNKGEKTIIFCHFPIAPVNIHNLLNYEEVLPLIENNGTTVAWISGHNHAGNYSESGGVHFLTLKGMVETETVSSFAIADVYSNRIEIRGFGNEKDRILDFK